MLRLCFERTKDCGLQLIDALSSPCDGPDDLNAKTIGQHRLIDLDAASFGDIDHVEGNNLPLVFHCIGGKDRTGMTAILLLSILGVPEDLVRADYIRSNDALGTDSAAQETFLSRAMRRSQSQTELSEENRAALQRFFILDDSYFEAAWDEIYRISGSFDEYVHAHLGLTDDHVASLRALLLEPAD